jgi:hypothetical protein
VALVQVEGIAGEPNFWRRTRQLRRSVKTATHQPARNDPADPRAHGGLAPSLAMARRPL